MHIANVICRDSDTFVPSPFGRLAHWRHIHWPQLEARAWRE